MSKEIKLIPRQIQIIQFLKLYCFHLYLTSQLPSADGSVGFS